MPEGDEERALAALMAAYQDGRLEAFDGLYLALEAELRRFFTARCHDASRIEDLVQETFLQIHRSRRAYLRHLPVRPWVYAIAKRALLMHIRRMRRRERTYRHRPRLRRATSVPTQRSARAAGR